MARVKSGFRKRFNIRYYEGFQMPALLDGGHEAQGRRLKDSRGGSRNALK